MRKKIFLLLSLSLYFLLAGCSFYNTVGSKNTVKVYTTLDKNLVEALCSKFAEGFPKEKRILFETINKETESEKADCIISEVTFLQQKAAPAIRQERYEFVYIQFVTGKPSPCHTH